MSNNNSIVMDRIMAWFWVVLCVVNLVSGYEAYTNRAWLRLTLAAIGFVLCLLLFLDRALVIRWSTTQQGELENEQPECD